MVKIRRTNKIITANLNDLQMFVKKYGQHGYTLRYLEGIYGEPLIEFEYVWYEEA